MRGFGRVHAVVPQFLDDPFRLAVGFNLGKNVDSHYQRIDGFEAELHDGIGGIHELPPENRRTRSLPVAADLAVMPGSWAIFAPIFSRSAWGNSSSRKISKYSEGRIGRVRRRETSALISSLFTQASHGQRPADHIFQRSRLLHDSKKLVCALDALPQDHFHVRKTGKNQPGPSRDCGA